MNKKLYIFFSLTSFAYMLSVSVYLLNSFIMLNDTIFAVTRILMICCLGAVALTNIFARQQPLFCNGAVSPE